MRYIFDRPDRFKLDSARLDQLPMPEETSREPEA